jgi:uncharacterized protein (UPF0335 family)
VKLKAFIEAVEQLARDPEVRRAQLKAIYEEIRNSTAHELAKAVEDRNRAVIALHKELTRPTR